MIKVSRSFHRKLLIISLAIIIPLLILLLIRDPVMLILSILSGVIFGGIPAMLGIYYVDSDP